MIGPAATPVAAVHLLQHMHDTAGVLACLGACELTLSCLAPQDFKEQVRAVILAYRDRLQERTQHHMGCVGSLG